MNESACENEGLTSSCYFDEIDGCSYIFGRHDPTANIAERIARAIDDNKLDQE